MSKRNPAPPCPEPLSNFAVQPQALYQQLGLSQHEFAQTFALSVGTIGDCEQDRVRSDCTTRVLLQVIAHDPEAVKQALRARGSAF